MNRGTAYSTPLGVKSGSSLFHDFVRPRGQFSPYPATSPFKGSPNRDSNDFIPLGFSSPILNKGRGGGGNNWRGNGRKSFSNSPSSSSCNSSFNGSPYGNKNRRFSSINRNRRDSNCLTNPGHNDDISQYYHRSMLEDPWAELERKLGNGAATQSPNFSQTKHERSNSNVSNPESVVLSDSDEGIDSQETDSGASGSDGS